MRSDKEVSKRDTIDRMDELFAACDTPAGLSRSDWSYQHSIAEKCLLAKEIVTNTCTENPHYFCRKTDILLRSIDRRRYYSDPFVYLKDISMKFHSFLLCAALITTFGCNKGPKIVEVTGKITVEGVPVDRGSITFVSVDGASPVGGGGIMDGTYIARVQPGNKKILVRGTKLIGQVPSLKGVPDSPPMDQFELVTDVKYSVETQTPLTVEILNESSQIHDLDLKKKL
jgi:hypothetical protein